MTDERPPDDPPAIADELVQALRLATEYILMLQPAMGSIDADVRRMVLTKAHLALLAATKEEP